MATHSSVLAWRISGTAEPGGLSSMGSHSRTPLKRFSSSSRVIKNVKGFAMISCEFGGNTFGSLYKNGLERLRQVTQV